MTISVSAGGIRREPTATGRVAFTTPQIHTTTTSTGATTSTASSAGPASSLRMTDSGTAAPSDSQATTEGNFDPASAGTIAEAGLPSVLSVVSKFRSSVQQELFLSSYIPEFESTTETENPPQFTIGRRYLKSDRKMHEQYESIEEEELRFITERITVDRTPTPFAIATAIAGIAADDAADAEADAGLVTVNPNAPTVVASYSAVVSAAAAASTTSPSTGRIGAIAASAASDVDGLLVDYDKLQFIYSEKEDEVLNFEAPFELQLDLEEINIPTVSTYVNSIQARNVNQEDVSALQESFEEQFSITGQTTGVTTDVPGAGSAPVYTDTGGSIGLGTRQSEDVTTPGASETETTRIVSGY